MTCGEYSEKESYDSGYESGKAFESELQESGDYIEKKLGRPLFCWRIKDSSAYGQSRKWQQRTICDFLFILDGETAYVEAKSSAGEVSYNFQYIEEHQFETMYAIHNAGGRSWFVFCKKTPKTFALERVWAVRADIVYKWHNERGSIKWKLIEEAGIELEQITKERSNSKRRWNILRLF